MSDPNVTSKAFPNLASFTSQGLPADLGFLS
jgi:hypothetical protein